MVYIRYDGIFLPFCKYSKPTMIKSAVQRKVYLLYTTYISFDRSRGMRRKILTPSNSINFTYILPNTIQFSNLLLALCRVLFLFGRYGRRKSTKLLFRDLFAVLISLFTFRLFLWRGSCLRISVSCL
jgi:hypothetical protein